MDIIISKNSHIQVKCPGQTKTKYDQCQMSQKAEVKKR